MTHDSDAERFLRAAVKTGLRRQRSEAKSGTQGTSCEVQTLQRIKASLRNRTSKPKSALSL